ncbi:hypothetical protein [Stieleria varia]|uniref:Uncharacterized protein n=1 Tax=Stieleria varia TaxID=2528005 RepID=A0A5C6B0V4_9BACT|nr:hypothetical protein [Stieleria varia]TWU05793.1 hypothetical protein Pla52n_15080 [Stieleria varia]
MTSILHVFAGTFLSRNEACLYTEPQWEPEPSDTVSDDEYAAWENRNPSWGFCDDLGDVYLDSDFIETIDGDERYSYLASYLVNGSDLGRVRAANPDANTLLLVFPDAFGGFDSSLRSTPKLTYCGGFDFRWP